MVMEVVVRKTTRGPDFKKTLQVNESDTLYQLKAKIHEAFGISPNSQYLHCFGRDLDGDSQTLERLGVKDESVIFIVQYASANRRSGSYDDLHAASVPDYQIVKPGLNYESVCNNTTCTAYQKTVVVNIGFRNKSVLQKDRWECNKCPICGETCGDISNIIFSRCNWKYMGYTTKGEKIQQEGVNINNETQGSQFPVNSYKWSYLEITTNMGTRNSG